MLSNMMRMVALDCWEYLVFCLSQLISTKFIFNGHEGTKNEVDVDFCYYSQLQESVNHITRRKQLQWLSSAAVFRGCI